MLPNHCRRPIDIDGEHARYCFNLDILYRDATLLYLAYLSSNEEQVNKFFDSIANKEYRYGLCETKREIDSFVQVLDVINKAEHRLG